jgi:polar amino acid transport system substrate-binding protein
MSLGFLSPLQTALSTPKSEPKVMHFAADTFPGLVEEIERGRICGLGHYLTKQATESIGYRYKVELLPLPRALKAIEANTRDGIIGIYKTEEREKFIQYTSQPFYTDTIRVFTLPNPGISWNGSIDSLKSMRIGVMQGWYYSDRFKKLERDDPRFRFEWIPLRESGFKMLRARRIDALISNDRNYENFLEKQRKTENSASMPQDIVPLNPVFEGKEIFIGFGKKVPGEVVQAFNKALITLVKDPKLQSKLQSSTLSCPSP